MEIWTTPHGFLKAAAANNATSTPAERRIRSRVHDRWQVQGTSARINAQNQVERVQTFIDNTVLGDTPVEIDYSDYRDFGGVRFPARIVRTQGGHPLLDLTIATVAVESIGRHSGAGTGPRRFTPPAVNVGREARRRRALRQGRQPPQRRHRAARSRRGRRSAAGRGSLAGGHRQGEGDDPGEADPLHRQLTRALRPFRRPAHLRRRGCHDRDARDEQALLRAGLGRAADDSSGSARASKNAPRSRPSPTSTCSATASGRSRCTGLPAAATTTRTRWSISRLNGS